MDIKELNELKKLGAKTLDVFLEVCQNSLERGVAYSEKLDFHSAIKEFTTVIEFLPTLTELTRNLNLPPKVAQKGAIALANMAYTAYLGRYQAYTQIGEKEKGNADMVMAKKAKDLLNANSQVENHKLSSSSQTPSAKTTASQSAQSTNASNFMTFKDFEYKRIDSGIEIEKYTGSAISVIIPKYIDDLPVTSIGEKAFNECTSLTSITIPESVTSIGDFAFSWCTSLTSITIPNSVTSIGNFAFSDCTSLTSITIPNSVTYIGWFAFSCCTSLTSITIPNSVTSISENAFWHCESLISVRLLNPDTIVGKDAFEDCSPSLKILRGAQSTEESSSDKGPPVIGCLFWIVVLLFILNFLFG